MAEVIKPEHKKSPEHTPEKGAVADGAPSRKILIENSGSDQQALRSEDVRIQQTASGPLDSIALQNPDKSTVHFGKTGRAERFEEASGEVWTSSDGKSFTRGEQHKVLQREGDNFHLKDALDRKTTSGSETDQQRPALSANNGSDHLSRHSAANPDRTNRSNSQTGDAPVLPVTGDQRHSGQASVRTNGDRVQLERPAHRDETMRSATDHERVSVDYLKKHPEQILNMSLNELKATMPAVLEDLQRRGYNPKERILGFGTGTNDPDNPFVSDPDKLYHPNPQTTDVLALVKKRDEKPSGETPGSTDFFGLEAQKRHEHNVDAAERDPLRVSHLLGKDQKTTEIKLRDDAAGLMLANASPEEERQFAQRQAIKEGMAADPDRRGSLDYLLKVPEAQLTPAQRQVFEAQKDLQATLKTGDLIAQRTKELETEYEKRGWGPDSHLYGTGNPELDRKFVTAARSDQPSDYENIRRIRTIADIRAKNPEIFDEKVDVSKLEPGQAKFREDIRIAERDTCKLLAQRVADEEKKVGSALTEQEKRHGLPAKAANSIAETVGASGGWFGSGYFDSDATPAAVVESLSSAHRTSESLVSSAANLQEGKGIEFEKRYHEDKFQCAQNLAAALHLEDLASVYKGREKSFADGVAIVAQVATTTAIALMSAGGAPETGGASLSALSAIPIAAGVVGKVTTEFLNDTTAETRDEKDRYTLPQALQDAAIQSIAGLPMPGQPALGGGAAKKVVQEAGTTALERTVVTEGEQVLAQTAAKTLLGSTAQALSQLTPQMVGRTTANFGVGLAKHGVAGGADGFSNELANAFIRGDENPLATAVGGIIPGAVGGDLGYVVGSGVKAASGAIKKSLANAADAPHVPQVPAAGDLDLAGVTGHAGEGSAPKQIRTDSAATGINNPHAPASGSIEPAFATYQSDPGIRGVGGRFLHNIGPEDGFTGGSGPGVPRNEDLARQRANADAAPVPTGSQSGGRRSKAANEGTPAPLNTGAAEGTAHDTTAGTAARGAVDGDKILAKLKPDQLVALDSDAARSNFVDLYNASGGAKWNKEQLEKALVVSGGPFANTTDTMGHAFLMNNLDMNQLKALDGQRPGAVRNVLAIASEGTVPGHYTSNPDVIAASVTITNSPISNLSIADQKNIARSGIRQVDLQRLADSNSVEAALNFDTLYKGVSPGHEALDAATGAALAAVSVSNGLRKLETAEQMKFIKNLKPEQLEAMSKLDSLEDARKFMGMCDYYGEWPPGNISRAVEICKSDVLRNLPAENQRVIRSHTPKEISQIAALDSPETIDKFLALRKLNLDQFDNPREGFTASALALLGSEFRDLPQPRQQMLLNYSAAQINKLAEVTRDSPQVMDKFLGIYDSYAERLSRDAPNFWTPDNLQALHNITTSDLNQLSVANSMDLLRSVAHPDTIGELVKNPEAVQNLVALARVERAGDALNPLPFSNDKRCQNAMEISMGPLRGLPIEDQMSIIMQFNGYIEDLEARVLDGAQAYAQKLRQAKK